MVIYKNSVVTVVLYIVFYQVKLNMHSKGSVIFEFLMSQIKGESIVWYPILKTVVKLMMLI